MQSTWRSNDSYTGDKRVAIVGLAVTYAGCNNKDEFYESLLAGKVQYTTMGSERLDSINKDLHLLQERSKYSDTFCNDRYAYLDKETYRSEHELLLKLAKEALTDYEKLKGNKNSLINVETDKIGVVSGCLSFPRDNQQAELSLLYQSHMEKQAQHQFPSKNIFQTTKPWSRRPEATIGPDHTDFCSDLSQRTDPASFVAEKLKMKNCPVSYSLDAACATSLYTLRLGQDHLFNGDCDVVLCGASTLPDPFFILSGFSTFQAIPVKDSPQDISAPWRSGSTGLTPGEGGCIVVMKRLEDAVRDGDFIYSSMLACGINNAGRGLPLKPLLDSELSCLRETYHIMDQLQEGKDGNIQYVECHATGTSQGDRVELDAMTTCFSERKQAMPLFGSSKGNFGHTLVAAGFAGMTKLLLSMLKGKIPPTPGIESDAVSMHKNVVKTPTRWPQHNARSKRGALSAFGFGGTNAHAVFERYESFADYFFHGIPRSLAPARRKESISILGMEASYGRAKNLVEVEEIIYNNDTTKRVLPEKRWRFLGSDEEFKGLLFDNLQEEIEAGFIEKIIVDFKSLRTPLTPEDLLIPQQLLCLSVMDNAINDAGIKKGARAAVLVGLGTDLELYRHKGRVMLKERLHPSIVSDKNQCDSFLNYIHDRGTSTSYTSYIGNLVATRLSAKHGFTGPSFTITEGENSALRALQLAQDMLSAGVVEYAVVAGVDMNCCAESFYVKSRNYRFDENIWLGEGAGAIVVTRTNFAKENSLRILTNIDSISSARNNLQSCIQTALECLPSTEFPEYIEVSGIPKRNHTSSARKITLEDEVCAINKSISKVHRNSIALGSVANNLGRLGYSSGIASLIKCTLSLYNRYIPGGCIGNFPESVSRSMKSQEHSFYVNKYSTPWVRNSESQRRYCAVSSVSESNSYFFIVLSDESGSHESQNLYSLSKDSRKLYLLEANDLNQLLLQLRALKEKLSTFDEETFLSFTRQLIIDTLKVNNTSTGLVFSLIATENIEDFELELDSALKGIPRAVKMGRNYSSRTGSFLSLHPLREKKVCLMYGEGRSPYPFMGIDLYRIWPGLHELTQTWTTQMWQKHGLNQVFHPRSITKEGYAKACQSFEDSQITKFKSGVFHSMQFTHFTLKVLKVIPSASCGLSLGEISMYFAFSKYNCCKSNELVERLENSVVWKKYMGGPCLAVKDIAAPHLSEEQFIKTNLDDLWFGYVIPKSKGVIRTAIDASQYREQLRLMIINNSTSCLVSGTPDALSDLIRDLGINKNMTLPVPQRMIGHCKEVFPYLEEIAKIHADLEIPISSKITMYTNIGHDDVSKVVKEKFPNGNLQLGNLAGEIYQQVADFEEIIKKVYDDGYRVFIEVGPDNQRSSAIKNILSTQLSLKDTEYVTGSIDNKGVSQWNAILQLVAILRSQRIQGVTLEGLYHRSLLKPVKKKHKMVREIYFNGRFKEIDPLPEKILISLPSATNHLTGTPMKRLRFLRVEPIEEPENSPIVTNTKNFHEKTLFQSTSLDFGDQSFLAEYSTGFPIYLGSLWKGISGVEFVTNAARGGILATYGTYQQSIEQVRSDLTALKTELGVKKFAVNVTCQIHNYDVTKALLSLLLELGIEILELSRFHHITDEILEYKLKLPQTKLLVKVREPSTALQFMKSLNTVFSENRKFCATIQRDQGINPSSYEHTLRQSFADDIVCQGSNATTIVLPVLQRLRSELKSEVRLGIGTNIGCAKAGAAAFRLGADFVSTGSINILAKEADISEKAKVIVSSLSSTDVVQSPLFGLNLFDYETIPIAKRGTMFSAKVTRLFSLFKKYSTFKNLPRNDVDWLEKRILKQSFESYWASYLKSLKTSSLQLSRIEAFKKRPQHEFERIRLALIFADVLKTGLSNAGRKAISEGKENDSLIWCGPCIGIFNDQKKGKLLNIVDITTTLMEDISRELV